MLVGFTTFIFHEERVTGFFFIVMLLVASPLADQGIARRVTTFYFFPKNSYWESYRVAKATAGGSQLAFLSGRLGVTHASDPPPRSFAVLASVLA